MRIAVWHNLPSGGAKRLLYDQIVFLKGRGHYIESWTTDQTADYLPLGSVIRENRKNISGSLDNALSTVSPVMRIKNIISIMKRHSSECAEEINSGGFDVLLASSCQVSYVPFIGLFSGIPAVLYLNEPNRALYEASGNGNIWKLPGYSFSLRYLMRYYRDFKRNYANRLQVTEEVNAAASYNRILVNSLFSKESVKRAYGLDAGVCYPGVNSSLFRINSGRKKQSFITGMGRISPAKNIELAISAVALIRHEDRPELFWISNGYVYDYLNYLEQLAKEKNVVFRPLIDQSDDDVIKILNEAAVFISTSRLEPFGLAPLEANMCGTYVISVAEGGFRETMRQGQNGSLINSGAAADLADAAGPFCRDAEYAENMGQIAREYCIANWDSGFVFDNIERELFSVSK